MNAFLSDVAESYFHGHIDRHGGPDSKFVRFDVMDHSTSSNFQSVVFNKFCGYVVYKNKGVNYASSLIYVKYYDSELCAQCWGILLPWMDTEMWFCETVLPALRWMSKVPLDKVVPALYAFQRQTLDATSATKCAILWEYLDGYSICGIATLLDYTHLAMMAEKIAHFHANSFGVRVKRPKFFTRQEPYYDIYSSSGPIVEILKRCLRPLVLLAPDNADVTYYEALERLQTMLADFESRLRRPFSQPADNVCRLVCHQYYTQQNVAFKHESGLHRLLDMRIVNWHWSGFASLGVDLVFLTAVEGRDRTLFFGPLLHEYSKALHNSIAVTSVRPPDREQILDEVKMCMPLALHVLAHRALVSSTLRRPSGELTYPPAIWNDQRITDTYKFMIELDLI